MKLETVAANRVLYLSKARPTLALERDWERNSAYPLIYLLRLVAQVRLMKGSEVGKKHDGGFWQSMADRAFSTCLCFGFICCVGLML